MLWMEPSGALTAFNVLLVPLLYETIVLYQDPKQPRLKAVEVVKLVVQSETIQMRFHKRIVLFVNRYSWSQLCLL